MLKPSNRRALPRITMLTVIKRISVVQEWLMSDGGGRGVKGQEHFKVHRCSGRLRGSSKLEQ